MRTEDYYKILGLSKDASQEAIKGAYRKLALKFHPDKNRGEEESLEKFAKIRKAYEILSNERKRKEYDTVLFYKAGKYSGLFYDNVSRHSNKISLTVAKRIMLPDDLIHVAIKVFEPGSDFHLAGKSRFEVVEGPVVRSFQTQKIGTPLLEINYILRPKEPGYSEIGPASFISNGVKYLSESVHIKVNLPPSEIRLRPFSREEKIHSAVATVVIIAYLSLLGYNLYKYDINPKLTANNSIVYSNPSAVSYALNDVQLPTGLAPYEQFFGPGIYDPASFNEIRFTNGQMHDAVVCLTDARTHKTIRNNYIGAGQHWQMSHIPNGAYYLKALFGNDWNGDKPLMSERVKGNFNRNVRFEIFHQEINLLQQPGDGDTLTYKVYEITLYPVKDGNAKSMISEEAEFFE